MTSRSGSASGQAELFDRPPLPSGFLYRPDILDAAEEAALAAEISRLSFHPFEFHGFLGRRRIVSYGWRYDFSQEHLQPADALPPFLLPLRARAALLAGLPAQALVHAMVTEYAPGAAIGWHRDKRVFDQVVGISLLAPCRFRLRRPRLGEKGASRWERAALTLQPRSAYLLDGAARSVWEHSIPAVERLRYSITFRSRAGWLGDA